MKTKSFLQTCALGAALAVAALNGPKALAQSNVFSSVFTFQGALQTTNNVGGLQPAPDGPYTYYCWPFWWHCSCHIPVPWPGCLECPPVDFPNLIDQFAGEATLDQLQTTTVNLHQGVFTLPFTVNQDFLAANAGSGSLYVQLWVQGPNDAAPVPLAQPQLVTSVPLAAVANTALTLSGTLPASSLSGTYLNGLSLLNSSNIFKGNGSGLVGVTALALQGGTALGQGVNNTLLATASDAFIGGGSANLASGDHAVVAGGEANTAGGTHAFVGGGLGNRASSDEDVVVGGVSNSVAGDPSFIGSGQNNKVGSFAGTGTSGISLDSFVVCGYGNVVNGNYSGIGGGQNNTIATNGNFSFIGGGSTNVITPSASYSFIGSGLNNSANSLYATLGGGFNNNITTNANYAFVGGGHGNTAGGGNAPAVGGGEYNQAIGDHPLVAGGFGNTAIGVQATVGGGWLNFATNSYATVPGGDQNSAGSSMATVSGGHNNRANGGNAPTIGGGEGNQAIGDHPTVGGGFLNTAAGIQATVSGGYNNIATNNYTTVPGGFECVAAGAYSFAAGDEAQAFNQGSFVWADSQGTAFSSTANNQVSFRCGGGARFTSGGSGADQTVTWTPGSASWSFSSDRNLKDRFATVNSEAVLEKVAQLPIMEWSYKGYAQRHIGAMAQDFHGLFPLNENDKALNDADLHGVALAAIQGLNQKLQEKDAEVRNLEKRLDELQAEVNQLTH